MGTVYGQAHAPGNELANASVQACKAGCCQTTRSASDKTYSFTRLNTGSYMLTAYPPPGRVLFPASRGPVVVTGTAMVFVDEDIVGRDVCRETLLEGHQRWVPSSRRSRRSLPHSCGARSSVARSRSASARWPIGLRNLHRCSRKACVREGGESQPSAARRFAPDRWIWIPACAGRTNVPAPAGSGIVMWLSV